MSCTPSPGKHHPIRAPFSGLFSWPAASRSWWAGIHCLWPSTIIFFLSKRNNSKRNKRNRVDIERIVGRLTSVPAICRKALPYSPGYLKCLKEERYMWLHWLQGMQPPCQWFLWMMIFHLPTLQQEQTFFIQILSTKNIGSSKIYQKMWVQNIGMSTNNCMKNTTW